MSEFQPRRYTISIRYEDTEDGPFYVSRSKEFPDMFVMADTPHEAYEDFLDCIETAKEMFEEVGQTFPEPQAYD